MRNILGREPAQWLQLASGILIFLTPVLGLTEEQNGVLMAAITAAFGLLTAWGVSEEKTAAAVAGLVKALIAVAIAFRLEISVEMQAGIMAGVEAVVGFWLRTQVTPKVPKRAVENGGVHAIARQTGGEH